jgi:hypothetical protein
MSVAFRVPSCRARDPMIVCWDNSKFRIFPIKAQLSVLDPLSDLCDLPEKVRYGLPPTKRG